MTAVERWYDQDDERVFRLHRRMIRHGYSVTTLRPNCDPLGSPDDGEHRRSTQSYRLLSV